MINDTVLSMQRLRFQRFGMSVATYVIAILATFLITRIGIGELSVTRWTMLIGLCLFGISLFFILFYTGANLRFSEPSLTREQIVYASLYGIVAMYWLPEARPIILLFFMPPFSFGMLSLTLRQYLHVVACVMGLYAALLSFEYFQDPQGFKIQYQLFLFVLFGILQTWFAFFGGFVSNIRRRLRVQKMADDHTERPNAFLGKPYKAKDLHDHPGHGVCCGIKRSLYGRSPEQVSRSCPGNCNGDGTFTGYHRSHPHGGSHP